MEGPSTLNLPLASDLSLSSDQRDLLLAALSSNTSKTGTQPASQYSRTPRTIKRSDSDQQNDYFQMMNPTDSVGPELLDGGTGNFDSTNLFESSFDDLLDVDGDFDLDIPEPNTDGNRREAAAESELDGYLHDKRKSTGDVNDTGEAEHDDKRREGDDKSAKKPGRKPITAEPTTKRKAQNRAAQRAFRERKERHLKDLETKVYDLEKASESANHENGILRAQVERLQSELREYRKRLSMNGDAFNRSPTRNLGMASNLTPFTPLNPSVDSFQFVFPKFGDTHFPTFGDMPITFTPRASLDEARAEAGTRQSRSSMSNQALASIDTAQSGGISPKHAANASFVHSTNRQATRGSSLPTTTLTGLHNPDDGTDIFSSMFNVVDSPADFGYSLPISDSPSQVNGSSRPEHPAKQGSQAKRSRGSADSYSSGPNRSPGSYPSSTNFDHASPSCPSLSQGTTPEASHESPTSRNSFGANENVNYSAMTKASTTTETSSSNLNSFEWPPNQNGGQFDPLLFGGYRESQDAIVGNGVFTNGFFGDDFSIGNWATPLAFNDNLSTVPTSNLIEQVDRRQDGNYGETIQGENSPQLTGVSGEAAQIQEPVCTKNIWRQIQTLPEFKDGTLDIDALCSEMKAKARCTESGAVVDRKDVDDIFNRASQNKNSGARTSCG